MARLSAGTLAVAVVAILLALTGAFAVRQFLEQRETAQADSVQSEAEVVTIPVAVTDLDQGRIIRESDFAPISMSREEFSKSKFAGATFIDNVDHLTGRVLRESVKSGSTVGPVQLYSEGTGPMVTEKLPAGMRAVTVKVNGSGFADGFASPGTFVDVLFRSTPSESGSSNIVETTITALTEIEVLAVDVTRYPTSQPEIAKSAAGTQTEEARVTFAVLPSEATMLKALEDRGEISLALRSLLEAPEVTVKAGQKDELQERHAQTIQEILEGVKATPVAIASTELV